MASLPAIPGEVWALFDDIGPRWRENVSGHVKMVCEALTPILKRAPKDGIEVHTVSYGPHERQAFEVFTPPSAGKLRPALLFVHGGAFVEGSRHRTDEIYANVLNFAAANGIVGINVGYRLAPDAVWPGASQDIGAVVRWVASHAEELSVDPARIFLMGHSAGGAHVASWAYDKRVHGPEGHGLAGLIVASGRVRAENLPENPNAKKVEAYYGSDASIFDDRSPVSHVTADSVPTLVAWCEFENPLIDLHCSELVYRLAEAKRRGPPVVFCPRHNHTSTVGQINTADDLLGPAILEFIDNPR